MTASNNFVQLTPDRNVAYGIVGTTVFRKNAEPSTESNFKSDPVAEGRRLASLPNADRIELADVKQIQVHEDDSREVRVVPQKRGDSVVSVDTKDIAAQRAFATALRAAVPGGLTASQGTNLFAALFGPVMFLLIFAFITFAVHATAAEIAAGTHHETQRVGRARARAQIVEAGAGALGTSGTLVVGGLLIALCAVWLVYEVKHVHPVITLKR